MGKPGVGEWAQCCGFCFGEKGEHPVGGPQMCARLQARVEPHEEAIMKTLNAAYGNADVQVIRLWIRVLAVTIAKTTPPPPRKAGTDPVHEAKFVVDCDRILSDWCRALGGAAELSM